MSGRPRSRSLRRCRRSCSGGCKSGFGGRRTTGVFDADPDFQPAWSHYHRLWEIHTGGYSQLQAVWRWASRRSSRRRVGGGGRHGAGAGVAAGAAAVGVVLSGTLPGHAWTEAEEIPPLTAARRGDTGGRVNSLAQALAAGPSRVAVEAAPAVGGRAGGVITRRGGSEVADAAPARLARLERRGPPPGPGDREPAVEIWLPGERPRPATSRPLPVPR